MQNPENRKNRKNRKIASAQLMKTRSQVLWPPGGQRGGQGLVIRPGSPGINKCNYCNITNKNRAQREVRVAPRKRTPATPPPLHPGSGRGWAPVHGTGNRK